MVRKVHRESHNLVSSQGLFDYHAVLAGRDYCDSEGNIIVASNDGILDVHVNLKKAVMHLKALPASQRLNFFNDLLHTMSPELFAHARKVMLEKNLKALRMTTYLNPKIMGPLEAFKVDNNDSSPFLSKLLNFRNFSYNSSSRLGQKLLTMNKEVGYWIKRIREHGQNGWTPSVAFALVRDLIIAAPMVVFRTIMKKTHPDYDYMILRHNFDTALAIFEAESASNNQHDMQNSV